MKKETGVRRQQTDDRRTVMMVGARLALVWYFAFMAFPFNR